MPNFSVILIPADDLAASRELYRAILGAEPSADSPYYVGFDIDGQHIGLVPGATSVRAHVAVEDMDAAVATFTDAGGSVVEEAKPVGGGRVVAVVRDPAGAEIGLFHDDAAGE